MFIVDAANNFLGASGNYTLSVKTVSRIGAVVGRVFDSVTKQPLTLQTTPWLGCSAVKMSNVIHWQAKKKWMTKASLALAKRRMDFPWG